MGGPICPNPRSITLDGYLYGYTAEQPRFCPSLAFILAPHIDTVVMALACQDKPFESIMDQLVSLVPDLRRLIFFESGTWRSLKFLSLRNLEELSLSALDVNTAGLRTIARALPFLQTLKVGLGNGRCLRTIARNCKWMRTMTISMVLDGATTLAEY